MQCISIGGRGNISQIPSSTCLKVDGRETAPSNTLKNLRINFDECLTCEKHINNITRKSRGTVMYLNRIKDIVSPRARTTAIDSLVLSSINYCIKIWGPPDAP